MKIETVIKKCCDCKYRKIYSVANNTDHLAVCTHDKLFIIDRAAGMEPFNQAIPDNCPLHDYPKPEEGLPIWKPIDTLKPTSE